MIAMILAAGRGERLRPITDEIPKALVEINGTSLLERHLEALKRSGVSTVVINLGWLGEQIVERIGSGSKFGINVVYSPEYDNVCAQMRDLIDLNIGKYNVENIRVVEQVTPHSS